MAANVDWNALFQQPCFRCALRRVLEPVERAVDATEFLEDRLLV